MINLRTLRALYLGAVIGAMGFITIRRLFKPKPLENSLAFPEGMQEELMKALDSGHTQIRFAVMLDPNTNEGVTVGREVVLDGIIYEVHHEPFQVLPIDHLNTDRESPDIRAHDWEPPAPTGARKEDR